MNNKIKYDSAVFVVDLKGIVLTIEQKEIIEQEIKEVIRRNINKFHKKYLFLNEDLLVNDRFYNICPRIIGIWLDELKTNVYRQLIKIKRR